MLMTYMERVRRCEKLFWTEGRWSVVVKCSECGRHGEACMPAVMSLDGKVRLAYCESCQTMTCLPVLKDKVTVAEVGE